MTTNRPSPPVQPSAGAGMPRLLTLRDVKAITALSRSAIYALMAESRSRSPSASATGPCVGSSRKCSTSSPAVPAAARIGPSA